MTKQERLRVISEFKKNKSDLLVVTPAGDEGIDLPDADTAILVSYSSSRRQFIQRIGRVLRPKDRPAEIYVLITRHTIEETRASKLLNAEEKRTKNIVF